MAGLSLNLAGSTAAGAVPTGTVVFRAQASTPSGYLPCDGAAVSRATYAALFASIGTTFGVGDGSTTFNVPDLRGRSPIGAGTGAGLTARTHGTAYGAESTAHTHGAGTYSVNNNVSGTQADFQEGTTGSVNLAEAAHTHASLSGSSGSDSTAILHPVLAVTAYIKT